MVVGSQMTVETHVVLLRGINVGGKNKLPMKDLVAISEAAGCADVVTYVQSGNVVCRAGASLARGLPTLIEAAILERFGLRVPVVMRRAAELGRVARSNPFLEAGASPDELHVAFLADVPAADRARALDPLRSPPDELALRGRDLYLRLPRGVARTKLTNAYLDATLATTSTLRNWRTVLALVELTRTVGSRR